MSQTLNTALLKHFLVDRVALEITSTTSTFLGVFVKDVGWHFLFSEELIVVNIAAQVPVTMMVRSVFATEVVLTELVVTVATVLVTTVSVVVARHLVPKLGWG